MPINHQDESEAFQRDLHANLAELSKNSNDIDAYAFATFSHKDGSWVVFSHKENSRFALLGSIAMLENDLITRIKSTP